MTYLALGDVTNVAGAVLGKCDDRRRGSLTCTIAKHNMMSFSLSIKEK